MGVAQTDFMLLYLIAVVVIALLIYWYGRRRNMGYKFLRMERRSGWTGGLPIYSARCPTHGPFEGHLSGYRKLLKCPEPGCKYYIIVLGEAP